MPAPNGRRQSNVPRVPLSPLEAQRPLIVDADAALAIPIAAQDFESMTRRHAQIVERSRAVEHCQLALRLPNQIRPQALHPLAGKIEQRFRCRRSF